MHLPGWQQDMDSEATQSTIQKRTMINHVVDWAQCWADTHYRPRNYGCRARLTPSTLDVHAGCRAGYIMETYIMET